MKTEELVRNVLRHQRVVISGPEGAGKTTALTECLKSISKLRNKYNESLKILVILTEETQEYYRRKLSVRNTPDNITFISSSALNVLIEIYKHDVIFIDNISMAVAAINTTHDLIGFSATFDRLTRNKNTLCTCHATEVERLGIGHGVYYGNLKCTRRVLDRPQGRSLTTLIDATGLDATGLDDTYLYREDANMDENSMLFILDNELVGHINASANYVLATGKMWFTEEEQAIRKHNKLIAAFADMLDVKYTIKDIDGKYSVYKNDLLYFELLHATDHDVTSFVLSAEQVEIVRNLGIPMYLNSISRAELIHWEQQKKQCFTTNSGVPA